MGPNLMLEMRNGGTPLYILIYYNYKKLDVLREAIPLLLSYGADVNIAKRGGVTPLMLLYEIKAFQPRSLPEAHFKAIKKLLAAPPPAVKEPEEDNAPREAVSVPFAL
ncbi:hypothetical protein GQ43DRAFT_474579 [Delitschia confertaspora ATCC 74209]|uniref:Ankyrin repeat protein n=1 Tax=Delitschia confertaspora ATCC 74209 TaxID=1513339 RepID=A0A9P4JFQ8_9PLEO|nr:hypothetical protein GQ43DRAFT_474579 [Delitschia confertaspora ATCC 74209]